MTIRKLIVTATVFAFIPMLSGCSSKLVSLDECQLDAMKSFGHLRKNMAFQHELEDRYVELCMDSKGFKLNAGGLEDIKNHPNLHIVGTEDRDIFMSQSENWVRKSISLY